MDSYKHFVGTTLPCHLPQWPDRLLQMIDNETIRAIASTKKELISALKNEKLMGELRKQLQDQVVDNLKLRSLNHPFKRA